MAHPTNVLGTHLRSSGEPLNWGAIFLSPFAELEKKMVILIYSGTLLFSFHFYYFWSEILNVWHFVRLCPSLPPQAKEAREGKQFEGPCLKRKSSKDDITRMQTEEAAHARNMAKGLRWGSLGKARQWPAEVTWGGRGCYVIWGLQHCSTVAQYHRIEMGA